MIRLVSFTTKVLTFVILYLLTTKVVIGQSENITKIYIGGSFGFNGYGLSQNEIEVKPYAKFNLDLGATILFDFSNKYFIKSGVNFTYYRSPFISNISTYDELIQIPVLFPVFRVKEINESDNLILSIGTQISILARQGIANIGDNNYQILPSSFGGFYKFGILSEFAIYSRKNNKFVHSYGLKFSMDLEPLYIKSKSSLKINNTYVTGGIFYNINRKSRL